LIQQRKINVNPTFAFVFQERFFVCPFVFFNRRPTQTGADINLSFSLADLAKEKQHVLRAKTNSIIVLIR
jgi:hypothetical protein